MKMPTNKIALGSKKEVTKADPEYKEKRIKNNDAVKKSRQKSKTNNKVTLEKVTEMKCVSIIIFLLLFMSFLKLLLLNLIICSTMSELYYTLVISSCFSREALSG